MSRISPESIEKVAAASDIVTVIGGYFPLKRAGSSFRALCPFHNEKSPSFHVNPQRQSYHCFGCGAGGTVFGFVMQYENLDFPTAVRRLAEKAGVPLIEEAASPDEDRKRDQRRRLIDLHMEATRFYHLRLLKSPDADSARTYLRSRGFGPETVRGWRLGYAPDGWENLIAHLRSKDFNDADIGASGLVSQRDEENPGRGIFDRFRDRLMIPICNDTGDVIAFSGRVLAGDGRGAKYVNSPETPLFVKGNVLFGLDRSKRALIDARSAIVCEGQLDLIRCFESGIQNVTAPQGTAFTPRQAAILKRYVEEVVLCFDADTAGRKAAERSAPALFEAGLNVRVAAMPQGDDPDSMIRTQGADAFRGILNAAQDYFDFLIEAHSAEIDLSSARGRSQFAGILAEAISPISDPVTRDGVTAKAASRIGVDPAIIRNLTAKVRPASGIRSEASVNEPIRFTSSQIKLPDEVIRLCHLLLNHPAVRENARNRELGQIFSGAPGGALLESLVRAEFRPGDPASVTAFLAELDPELQALAGRILAIQVPDDPGAAESCWNWLTARDLKERLQMLKNRIAQPDLPDNEVLPLQKEILDLKKQLTEIARPL